MATHVACCEDTLALVHGGTVYAGKLTGDGLQVCTLSVLEPLPSLPVPVRRIGAGKGFLGITTADGELYTWGRNLYGQLGLDFASRANVTTPTLVRQFVFEPGRVQVHDFAGGWDHSVVITDHGVFACGNNSNGVLGNDEVQGESHRFYPVDWKGGTPLHKASCVACGDGHTVLLSSGSVITWGVKDYQCLGKTDSYHVQRPRALPPGLFRVKKMVQGQEIDSVPEIVHVAAGKSHQAAVGADGTVFTWGDNSFCKLGRGFAINSCTPMPVVLFQSESGDADACIPHIISVHCGSKCTVMLARDGNVHKAGKRNGQSWRAGLPHKISAECLGPVRAAAVTNERVFAVDERGALWAWGVDLPVVFDRELAVAPVHRGVVWPSEHAPMRLDPPEWRSANALAFAMLGHRRLGAGSGFGMLDVSLLDMILRFLRAW
tara:strand:+ start:541 stop:1839 length:1299 start_codon:yes stop_codon:yes gene_type:complete